MPKTIRPCNPRDIDDAGMSPAQFRVFFRIVRRAGNSWCYETSQEMADGCRMSKPTVLAALKWLHENGLVEKTGGSRSKKYRPISKPALPTGDEPSVKNEPPLVNEIDQSKKPVGKESTPIGKTILPKGKESTPKGSTTGEPLRGNHNTCSDPPSEFFLDDQPPEITPEEIYQAYPKKVKKPQAIRAIKKALKRKPPNELLKLTTDYAACRHGSNPQFTPHPATWFNNEQYNDDPGTWGDKGGGRTSGHRSVGTANQGRTYGARAGGNAPKPLPDL